MNARCSTPEMMICVQCGDRGFTNAFVYCIKCLNVAVHRYCLDVIPNTIDEFVQWFCDDCDEKVQDQPVVQCKIKDHSTYNHVQVLERNLDGKFEGHAMYSKDNNIQIVEDAQEMSSSSTSVRCSRTVVGRINDFISQSSQPLTASSHPDVDTSSGSLGGSLGDSVDRLDIAGSSSRVGRYSEVGTDTHIQLQEVSMNLFPMDPTINPTKVSQVITASFKKHVDREGVAWRFVSEQFKDTYWEEFKKSFQWEMPLANKRVYELWTSRAAARYRDWISEVKRKRLTKGRPPYILEDIWSHWCTYWDTDKVKGMSEKAKKNRLSEPDGPGTGYGRHRGGSRSAVAYSYDLAREQGIPMGQTVISTFRKLHYNQKKGTYTSEKAKHIAEKYEAQIADMSRSLPKGVQPTLADHAEIFVGIAHNPAKHRVFGLGSLYQPEPVGYGCASFPSATSTFSGTSQPHIEKVQAELRVEREARLRVEGELASLGQKFTSFQDQFEHQQEQYSQQHKEQQALIRQQQALINRLLNERDTPKGWRS